MARKMFFSAAASTDDRIMEAADLCPDGVLLWPWLLPHLDDWGRGSGNPRVIKAAAFPALPVDETLIESALAAFDKVGLLERYEDDAGRPVIAVNRDAWFRYQTHIRKEKRDDDGGSQWPPPPGSAGLRAESRNSAENRAHYASPRFASPSYASEPSYPQLVEVAEKIVDERAAEGYDVRNREALVASVARSEEARHRWFKEQQPADLGWTGIGGDL